MTDDRLLEAAPTSVVKALLALVVDAPACAVRLEELRGAKVEADNQLMRVAAREAALERREQVLREREEAIEASERRATTTATNAYQQLEALRDFDRQIDDRLELIAVREAQIKAVVAKLSRSEFADIIENPDRRS